MSPRIETIGLATLYLGDCREIAPTLDRPAAVISDPPYGMGYNGIRTTRNSRLHSAPLGGGVKDRSLRVVGDDARFDWERWSNSADAVLLWGAHRWTTRPCFGGLLVWVKRPRMAPAVIGDGEAAWCSVNAPLRCFEYLWNGLAVQGGASVPEDGPAVPGKGLPRKHPTQKPAALMSWCITQAKVPAGGTILDPYAGSGSTIVAAVQMRHPAIGIEIDPAYFDVMCRRVEAAQRQGDIFRDAVA